MDCFILKKNPQTGELTGGDLLAQTLKQLQVEVAFGLHGGHFDAFLVGCQSAGIRLVDTRHETLAVQAAESYAKFSKKIGVCFVTANSGFANGLPGLATAFADHSPILCITSSPPMRDVENNSLQGIIDQVVVSRPMTKFAYRMTNPEDTPRIVKYAVGMALNWAPGPVLLDFPIDVFFTPVHEPLISWGSISSPLPYKPGPRIEAIVEAAELLSSARRPVIILGSGANSQEVAESVLKLSGDRGIPVFDTLKCHISFVSRQHSLYSGSSNNLALLPALNIQQPDLVLLLGARTGMFLGGRSGAVIPSQDCKLVHIDIDGSEIGRTLPTHLGAVSDIAQFITALNGRYATTGANLPRSVDRNWVREVVSIHDLPPPFTQQPQVHPDTGRLHPYHTLKHVFTSIPKGSIVILDGGEAAFWAAEVVFYCSPMAVVRSTGSLGFLGNGFGYALGASLAYPNHQIINLQGDGSAGFYFMDLDTYKRHNLKIMTIVVNNNCWGMSLNGQELVYKDDHSARPISSLSHVTDYSAVAKGLGNSSERVDAIEGINDAVARLGSEEGPTCLELLVYNKPIHPVTTAMVGETDTPGMVTVPYYDNVPRASHNA